MDDKRLSNSGVLYWVPGPCVSVDSLAHVQITARVTAMLMTMFNGKPMRLLFVKQRTHKNMIILIKLMRSKICFIVRNFCFRALISFATDLATLFICRDLLRMVK